MDVANVNKPYLDATGAANKSKDANSEDLMGRFSAAVAARINSISGHGGSSSKSQNALVETLNSTSTKPQETHTAETAAPVQRNDVDDAPEASDTDDTQTRNRTEPAEARTDTSHEHDDAPRDAGHDAASDDGYAQDDRGHADAASTDTRGDDGQPQDSATETAPQATEDGGETQVANAAQTNANEGKADPVLAAVQQLTTEGQSKNATGENIVKTAAVQAAGADGQAKQAGQNGAKTAETVANGPAVEADAGDEGPDFAVKAKDGKAKAAAQAQTAAGVHGKANANAQAAAEKGPTVQQQQAADLSKKLGPDQAVKVNVNVTDQSEELVSKPTANLAAQTAVKKDGESLTPTGVQTATKGQGQQNAQLNPNANAGQNNQEQQPQNQQAPVLAAKAEAAKAAANTQARAAEAKAINGVANSGAHAAKAGGAEGAPAPQAAAQSGNAPQTQHTHETAKPQQTPQQAQTRAQVTEQVTVQISKALNDGMDKIRIQLKPAHLGRVDVQLDIAQDGKVTAVISADNKDTLDLLKQDSRELERALREAGLDLGGNDLSFNMRGEGGQGGQDGDGKAATSGQPAIAEPTLEELLETQNVRRDIISDDRVDITA